MATPMGADIQHKYIRVDVAPRHLSLLSLTLLETFLKRQTLGDFPDLLHGRILGSPSQSGAEALPSKEKPS